jgi:hypothetical protein
MTRSGKIERHRVPEDAYARLCSHDDRVFTARPELSTLPTGKAQIMPIVGGKVRTEIEYEMASARRPN